MRRVTRNLYSLGSTAVASLVAVVVFACAGGPNARADDWIQLLPPAVADWAPRYDHTAVVFANRLWVIGGLGGTSMTAPLNDVWSSSDGVNWIRSTPSADWSPRYHHTSVVFDGRMWVLGGQRDEIAQMSDVWFSSDGAAWTQATSSAGWGGRSSHASVVFDGKMWVLGGWANLMKKNDVWYSADGINWTLATPSAPWQRRFDHAAGAFNGRMWILGGLLNVEAQFGDVWSSADGMNWEPEGNFPGFGVSNFPAAAYAGRLWQLGGYRGGIAGDLSNDVSCSENGRDWTTQSMGTIWSKRQGHASVVFGGKLWVLGGYGFPAGNDVWYLDLSTSISQSAWGGYR